MRNASKLKDFNKYKIFINNDLTYAEREIQKEKRLTRNKLNSELPNQDSNGKYGIEDGKKYHYGIRYGDLTKIYHQEQTK